MFEMKTAERGRVRRALLRWYRTQGRNLPWRKTRDAYAVLVRQDAPEALTGEAEWTLAVRPLPRRRRDVYDWNQGLMDLGAMVCWATGEVRAGGGVASWR